MLYKQYLHSMQPIRKSHLIKKLAITKENLHTKYTQFTYNDIALNKKLLVMKQNLYIFFVIGRIECIEFTKSVKFPWMTCKFTFRLIFVCYINSMNLKVIKQLEIEYQINKGFIYIYSYKGDNLSFVRLLRSFLCESCTQSTKLVPINQTGSLKSYK